LDLEAKEIKGGDKVKVCLKRKVIQKKNRDKTKVKAKKWE
jgi:hypothetical protein